MNVHIDNGDSLENPGMDLDDFIFKLEKAAAFFLNLLQMNKYFNAQLSSISVVCKVAQFIQCHCDLGCISEKEAQRQLLLDNETQFQNTAQVSGSKVVSTIAVKKRRQKRAKQTISIHTTRSTTRKNNLEQSMQNCNNAENKQTVRYVDDEEEAKAGDNQADNLIKFHHNHAADAEDLDNTDLPLSPKPGQLLDFQCSYCYKIFIDRRNLKSHLWVHEREKSFKCEVCKKMFLRSHQLTRHRRVHTGEKPYPCSVCGKAFADVSNLNTHRRKEHPNHMTLLRCEQCGKECQSRKDLKAHLATHSEEDLRQKLEDDSSDQSKVMLRLRRVFAAKTKMTGDREAFLCQICGKNLNKRAALLAHMKRHIRKKDFRCEFCNKVFPELRELKIHRQEHNGDRPYKCEQCGKGFKSQGTLRSHLGVHSGEQPYGCDVCGRTFSQTSGLNQHKLKHTAEEERLLGSGATDSQHRCDICGRCYKTKFRLQLHLRSHDSKRDVSCDFCEKKFQTAQDLAIHRRSHTKDKYTCRVCGASFKSRSAYYFHTRTHQIDRPYLCSACGKSFVSINDLNAHKRRHTVGNIFKKPHEQFVCNVCGRIYQMKNSLIIHMKIHQGIFDHPCDFCEKKFKSHAELRHHRRVHTQEKPYPCETCSRHFSRHSTLVNHRRTHSGDRPYMCTICGAAFKLSCTLKKHAKIHAREAEGGKRRLHSGKTKSSNLESATLPSTEQVNQQQIQQQQEQLQHRQQLQQHQQVLQHSSLSLCLRAPAPNALPQFMQKTLIADSTNQAHFIHELKPAPTNIMHVDNSTTVHDRGNMLDPTNPTSSLIHQSLREGGQNDEDERETARNLIEMHNLVPYNPGNNTFAPYYYY